MNFAARMHVASLEIVAAMAVFAVLTSRLRPILKASAPSVPAPQGVTFEIREPGGTQRLEVAVPAVIGRARDADVMLLDPEVSRRHALCDVENGVLYLTDLGSSNGTFLNGKLLEESIELQPGDTIDLGNSRLTLVSIEAGPP